MYQQDVWEEKLVKDFIIMRNDFETILFEIKNSIGFLTINREKKLNALNSQVLGELDLLLKNFDHTLKGLIITGAGERAFIAGADISQMAEYNSKQAEEFAKKGQELFNLFENLNCPVIACVDGFALGGGCELAMSADFIFATQKAIFAQPEVRLGIIPGFGGTVRLSRYVGAQKAKEIIYSGRNIKAQEALELGLVFQLFVSKEEMLRQAESLLTSFDVNSSHAIALSKKAINQAEGKPFEQRLNIEREKFADCFSPSSC